MKPQNVKCVLVGDGGVGKSSYLYALRGHLCSTEYQPTVGVSHDLINHDKICFTMWDTGGKRQYRGLKDRYYTDSDCAMVCFDLSRPITLKSIGSWLEPLSKVTDNIVLLGMKADQTKINRDLILELAKQLDLSYFEISSYAHFNLRAPLEYLHGQLMNSQTNS